MTTTLAENLFVAVIRYATPLMAACGLALAAQLPAINVTSGWSALARRTAQLNQAPQPQLLWVHELGTQPPLTSGTTAQLSRRAIRRIVGIHICACESPSTTIVLP